MIACLAIVSLIALAMVWLTRRSMFRLESDLAAQIKEQQNELSAILDGTFGVGKQVQELAKDLRDIKERQQRLETSDQGELPYNQAMRMVTTGADVDQLVESCGLSRSEAELVLLLHEKSPPMIETIMEPDVTPDDVYSASEAERSADDPDSVTDVPKDLSIEENVDVERPVDDPYQQQEQQEIDAEDEVTTAEPQQDKQVNERSTASDEELGEQESVEKEAGVEQEVQPSSIERAGDDNKH